MNNETRAKADDHFLRWLPIYRLLLLIAVVFIALEAIFKATRGPAGDIDAFVHAARLVLSGDNFYDIPNRFDRYYIYPPLFAILVIPLTFIQLDHAVILWCLSSIALIGWSIPVFYKSMTGVSFFSIPPRIRWTIGVLSVLMIERFIEAQLVLSQANVFIMALAVSGLAFWSQKREIRAGLLIGLSGIIKPLTYPLGVLFLARRNFRLAGWMIAGVVVGIFLPALVFGVGENIAYHKEWIQKAVLKYEPGSTQWIDTYNFSLQSQGLRFLTDAPAFHHGTERYFFTLWKAPAPVLFVFSWAMTLFVPVAVALFAVVFRKAAALASLGGGVAFAFSLMPLSTTVAQENHFVLLLPPCIYILHLWLEREVRDFTFRSLVVASFILMQLTSRKIWGDFYSEIFVAVGMVTLGSLLLSAAVVRGAHIIARRP
ncbi:MAG: glycosyltransferase family 87 protein [Bacteroidota bacterium]